ncbi:hypothetical protein CSB93_5163 [Pseudomonas paraeruginosa]|uniref:Uncharacterized protein n=1 Tax=Pseudomonas paraeruginosa TaxID=2994495 RepID=A0A2R3IZ84_9PSED|nr:hypothetical protein CSB93_5163 [Pseudomonas paraeruginosa]PTC36199.1 hypothetical protein CLJ1_3684 [Pseudomonas aeruginosa]
MLLERVGKTAVLPEIPVRALRTDLRPRRDHRHDEGCAGVPSTPAFNAYLTAATPQS